MTVPSNSPICLMSVYTALQSSARWVKAFNEGCQNVTYIRYLIHPSVLEGVYPLSKLLDNDRRPDIIRKLVRKTGLENMLVLHLLNFSGTRCLLLNFQSNRYCKMYPTATTSWPRVMYTILVNWRTVNVGNIYLIYITCKKIFATINVQALVICLAITEVNEVTQVQNTLYIATQITHVTF